LSGEAILFAGLWNKGVRAGAVDVDAFRVDCEKDAPRLPFFGDIFRGEALARVKSGAAVGFPLSRKREPPRFGVSLKLNLKGDEVGARLAGLAIYESLKLIEFPGGSARWPLSATGFWLRFGVKLILRTGELRPVPSGPCFGVGNFGSPFSSTKPAAFFGVKLILRTGELNPVVSNACLAGECTTSFTGLLMSDLIVLSSSSSSELA
jgi:hypothetical protein